MTDQHSALNTRDDLLAIADHWHELQAKLTPTSTGNSEVHTPAGPRVPIDAHVSDVITEITVWTNFLARTLTDETDWTAPTTVTVPALLRSIARTRLGHFTEHPDTELRHAFHNDAAHHRRKLERTIRPPGTRTIRLGITCITCDGQYAMTITPGQADTADVMTCTKSPLHTIRTDDWTVALRRHRGNHHAARTALMQPTPTT